MTGAYPFAPSGAATTVGLLLLCLILQSEAKCSFKIGVVQSAQLGTTDWLNLANQAYEQYKVTDPKVVNLDVTISPIVPSRGSEFGQLKTAHQALKKNSINAIFGPLYPPFLAAASELDLPYISTDIADTKHRQGDGVLFNLLPDGSEIVELVKRIATNYEWENVAIMYDSELGISIIENLVQKHDLRVTAWKMNSTFSMDNIKRDLLEIRRAVIRVIIVICDKRLTQSIIGEALRFSMLSSRFFWLLPTLNPYEINFDEFINTSVYMSVFRALRKQTNTPKGQMGEVLHSAIADDSVRLMLHAFSKMEGRGNCSGNALLNYIRNTAFNGKLGQISFKKDGSRDTYGLDILALTATGLVQIGTWNTSLADQYRLIIKKKDDWANLTFGEFDLPFGKKVLQVVTIIESPFVKYKEGYANKTGNDRFEGYCIDLLNEIASIHKFEYEVYLVPDNKFGAPKADGVEWDGIVGELISNRADLAVASLTINVQREQAIDFSKPFMNLGISILMKKPEKEPSFFQFLEPLSPIVWILVFVAFFVVSLVLFILDKVYPSNDMNVRFDLKESMWFNYGALVQAGTETIPRTLCGRILTSSWWFFSLILISSYTANLAAFLTVSKINSPIKGVSDLVGQTKVEYGTVWNSQVMMFFKNSKITMFDKIWSYMSTIREGMVENSEEGINRVVNSTGDYAFLWDSPVVKYQTTLHCELMEVGHPFDSKGYGIGVPPGAPYRDQLTMAILRLNEEGILQHLEERWWRDSKCPDDSSSATSVHKELTLEMVAGVFFLLAAGVAVSVIVCLIEWWWRKRRNRKKPKDKEAVNSSIPFTTRMTVDARTPEPQKPYHDWKQENGPEK